MKRSIKLIRQLNFNNATSSVQNALMGQAAAQGANGSAQGQQQTVQPATKQLAQMAMLLNHCDWPLPDAIAMSAASAAGGGAASTRVYFLNQDALQNIDDNGSGAGSITYNYSDVPAGSAITGGVITSRILIFAMCGLGAMIFGLTIQFVVTIGGAGDPTGLGASNPYFLRYDTYGTFKPFNVPVTMDFTRGDFQTNITVAPGSVYFSAVTQFSAVLPTADTCNVTLYPQPNFKR